MSFKSKDEINVEGITSDYVWYHAKVLTAKMQTWGFEFERITKVMEDRHDEHLKIISDLLAELKELKQKIRENKEWVGLTDEEAFDAFGFNLWPESFLANASQELKDTHEEAKKEVLNKVRAIEAKLKEKNGG